MKLIAIAVLIIGSVIAATAAMRMPADDQKFPPTWPFVIVGTVIAAAGVGLWHWEIARERRGTHLKTDEKSDPFVLLKAIQEPLQRLQQSASSMTTHEITTQVESLIRTYVVPFSEVRNKVTDQLGMRRGAEVLVDFAVVERMLNRAWSAASDQYQSEAVSSIEEASTAYTTLLDAINVQSSN